LVVVAQLPCCSGQTGDGPIPPGEEAPWVPTVAENPRSLLRVYTAPDRPLLQESMVWTTTCDGASVMPACPTAALAGAWSLPAARSRNARPVTTVTTAMIILEAVRLITVLPVGCRP